MTIKRLAIGFICVFLWLPGLLFFAGAQAAAPTAGNLWAWGIGDQGELAYVGGIGYGCSTACQPVPTAATPYGGFIEVSGGNYFSLGLKSDGSVWVWGYNPDGVLALGYADFTVSYSPLQVQGLSGVVHIAAGAKHALALKSDGTVWAWGSNFYGEIGSRRSRNCPDGPCVPNPVQVDGPRGLGNLNGVTAIRAGVFFSVALKSDGSVWTWGSNAFGSLGDGTYTNSSYPTRVSAVGGRGSLSGVLSIGAGSQTEHVLAVLSGNSVVGWGDNHTEQLGQPCNAPDCSYSSPIAIGGISAARAVSTGYGTSFVMLADGTAMALGDNTGGGLGIGATPNNSCGFCVLNPTAIPGLTNLVDLVAGFPGSGSPPLALRSDGTVLTVSSGFFVPVPALSAVSAIGMGEVHSLAVSAATLPIIPAFVPNQLKFPNTLLGRSSSPLSFTISNLGTNNLVLSGLTVTDADLNHATYSYEFTVPAQAFPITIQPGASVSFPVTFSPTNTGCAQAILAFTTNAPNTPTSVYAQGCPA